jgi:Putative addiction module component
MSIENMLSTLTQAEKLAAIDILWRDLAANPAELTPPDWHGDVLRARIENPSSKPQLSVDAAIDDVKERLNARRTQG